MNRWFGTHDTPASCPSCKASFLKIRFSCLETSFVCDKCHGRYTLDQLAAHLDDKQFEAIEEMINHRLSDRI